MHHRAAGSRVWVEIVKATNRLELKRSSEQTNELAILFASDQRQITDFRTAVGRQCQDLAPVSVGCGAPDQAALFGVGALHLQGLVADRGGISASKTGLVDGMVIDEFLGLGHEGIGLWGVRR